MAFKYKNGKIIEVAIPKIDSKTSKQIEQQKVSLKTKMLSKKRFKIIEL